MKKAILISMLACGAGLHASAQVKIGHDAAGAINNGAVLELSNDVSAAANTWKALMLPYVNFTSVAAFADSSVWGIAGTATDGALVYNTGSRTTDGFKGKGAYVWTNDAWVPLNNQPMAGGPAGCSDPGPAVGSTGCVTFTYKGVSVSYPTVRAADGKIWLQKNLGAAQVATSSTDAASYGDYFQWGRWDDGHQTSTSSAIAASMLSASNPSGLGAGNPNFVTGPNPNDWWGNGAGSDTWTAGAPSATNGTDPCSALGTGWHIATVVEWGSLITTEGITGDASAFSSNLKLSLPGSRDGGNGSTINVGSGANYWANEANGPYAKDVTIIGASVNPADDALRGYGMSVRCMKN